MTLLPSLKLTVLKRISVLVAAVFLIPLLLTLSDVTAASEETSNENADNTGENSKHSDYEYELKQLSYAPGLSSLVDITGRKCDNLITVQVLKNGKPVSHKSVEFSIIVMPEKSKGTALSRTSAVTDASGKATTQITLGEKAGKYIVAAYLDSTVSAAKPVNTQILAMTPQWLMFLIFGLLGGLGLFLYGMNLAGDHLQKAAGDKMRVLIAKLTSNRVSAVLVGTVASGVLQSSSAATVMLVGFVSATMMTLTQAIAVTMGTKVGVTITVQLIAFDISKYSLAIVGAGAVLIMAAGRKEKLMHAGSILLGFGLIFFGLSVMSGSMKPLRGIPEFAGMLIQFSQSSTLAILAGTAFTAIIQSAAATVAICFALANQGLLPLEAAIPISMGATVGTCATALLACLGSNRDGKRVAIAHLIFSVSVVIVIAPFLVFFNDFVRIFTSWMGSDSITREIANGFMFFNILAAVIALPFVGAIRWLTMKVLPISKEEVPFGPKYINSAALQVPLMALEQAQKEVDRMTEMVGTILKESLPAIFSSNKEKIDDLKREIKKLDILKEAIRPFLASVAQKGLNEESSAKERALIYITEHLGGAGHLINNVILHSGVNHIDTGCVFSQDGTSELTTFHEKMIAKYEKIFIAISEGSHAEAEEVLQLSFKERAMERKFKDSHLERLHTGKEKTMKSSADHLSILSGLLGVGRKFDEIAQEILRGV